MKRLSPVDVAELIRAVKPALSPTQWRFLLFDAMI
jgi:hypothetical protein